MFSNPMYQQSKSVPEFIDPVFTKTSPKRSFSLNRKRAFWLVFAKTGSIISGTGFKSSNCGRDNVQCKGNITVSRLDRQERIGNVKIVMNGYLHVEDNHGPTADIHHLRS
jgi:hypothetical protein